MLCGSSIILDFITGTLFKIKYTINGICVQTTNYFHLKYSFHGHKGGFF